MATHTENDTFDVIIVGGGTAGSLLASRLSSDPSLRILVLEAGQNRNDDPDVKIPGLAGGVLGHPDYDWLLQTLPEEGLGGRVIKQPRGKLWGGSSAINSHALVYPSKGYHDSWDELLGNENVKEGRKWNWDGIRKYYEKFQNVQEVSDDVKRELKISTVPVDPASTSLDTSRQAIQASYPVVPHVLQKAWVEASQELGYSSSSDPLGGEVIGGSITTNAIDTKKAERSHAGVAFLEPSSDRKNLFIRSNVLVEKIIFEETLKDGKLVASGALYRDPGGNARNVYARQEVLLCGGTFGSPKILELSGIGKGAVLSAAGIQCIRDLPGVGENLQDHLNFGPSVEVHDTIDTAEVRIRDPAQAVLARELYDSRQEGILAGGGAYSFSYMPTQLLSSPNEQQEIDDYVDEVLQDESSTTSKGLEAQYEIISRMIRTPAEATASTLLTRKQRYTPPSEPASGNYSTILTMLSYPFSRGSSHVQDSDPNVPPQIKFNYLQHPLDVEILSRHVIQIGRILKSQALSKHLKPNGQTLPAGMSRHPEKVVEIEEYVRKFAATNYHPGGTCAMMSEDLGGVVDESLKVYGTANLRVCDASVIPILPRGNILSTVYALAEKGADILKDDLAA